MKLGKEKSWSLFGSTLLFVGATDYAQRLTVQVGPFYVSIKNPKAPARKARKNVKPAPV